MLDNWTIGVKLCNLIMSYNTAVVLVMDPSQVCIAFCIHIYFLYGVYIEIIPAIIKS